MVFCSPSLLSFPRLERQADPVACDVDSRRVRMQNSPLDFFLQGIMRLNQAVAGRWVGGDYPLVVLWVGLTGYTDSRPENLEPPISIDETRTVVVNSLPGK